MSNRDPSSNKPRTIVPSDRTFFDDVALRIKLIVRLMGDQRISLWIKLLPMFSLVYFLFPDVAPGPIDDAAIIGLGFYLFVELCPPDIVQEHMDELTRVIDSAWEDPEEIEGEIIDADFTEVD